MDSMSFETTQLRGIGSKGRGQSPPAYAYQKTMGDPMANLLQSRFREAREVLENHQAEVVALKADYEADLQKLKRETDEALEQEGSKPTPTEVALKREELAEVRSGGAAVPGSGGRGDTTTSLSTRGGARSLPTRRFSIENHTEDFQALLESSFPEGGEAALLSALRTTLSGELCGTLRFGDLKTI